MDEEAALEQAVKFCQVHMGASAQKQVSSVKSLLLVTCFYYIVCKVKSVAECLQKLEIATSLVLLSKGKWGHITGGSSSLLLGSFLLFVLLEVEFPCPKAFLESIK